MVDRAPLTRTAVDLRWRWSAVFSTHSTEREAESFLRGGGYYTLHLPCSFHGLLVPGKIGYFLQLIDEFSNCGIWWEWYWKHMWQANSKECKEEVELWIQNFHHHSDQKWRPFQEIILWSYEDYILNNVFCDHLYRHSIPVLVKGGKAKVLK